MLPSGAAPRAGDSGGQAGVAGVAAGGGEADVPQELGLSLRHALSRLHGAHGIAQELGIRKTTERNFLHREREAGREGMGLN